MALVKKKRIGPEPILKRDYVIVLVAFVLTIVIGRAVRHKTFWDGGSPKARCQHACESVGLEVYQCTEYGDKLYGVECEPKGGD